MSVAGERENELLSVVFRIGSERGFFHEGYYIDESEWGMTARHCTRFKSSTSTRSISHCFHLPRYTNLLRPTHLLPTSQAGEEALAQQRGEI